MFANLDVFIPCHAHLHYCLVGQFQMHTPCTEDVNCGARFRGWTEEDMAPAVPEDLVARVGPKGVGFVGGVAPLLPHGGMARGGSRAGPHGGR